MRKIIGILIYVVFGLYVFISELILIEELMGILGIILGIFFFPILLVVMPFYALFAYGNWILLTLSILTPLVSNLIIGEDY